jgi:enoyl-CoA hydratase
MVSDDRTTMIGRLQTAPDPRYAGDRRDQMGIAAGDYRALAIERLDHVLQITIAHPDNALNAVDALLHEELTRVFRELKREDEARAVLLTGRGRAFSAGGSFDWFPTLSSGAALEHLRRDAKQMIWDLLDVELPIVVALNGPAVGLGASLALLCDVIFMAPQATLVDPHVRVGIVAGDGGAAIWPLVLGPARAKQFLLTGDPVSAEDAYRMGLVNRVVEADALEEEALAFATRLAAGAPLAVRYTKQAVNKLVKDALNTAFDTSTALEIVTFQSEDHREALAAMREKRKPVFRGR